MTISGSFHRNSSVDRLYTIRSEGGRGLNSVVDIFLCRVVSVAEHLREQEKKHPFLEEVCRHEEDKIVRLANEICGSFDTHIEENPDPKKLSQSV